jgi:hypothetical protein
MGSHGDPRQCHRRGHDRRPAQLRPSTRRGGGWLIAQRLGSTSSAELVDLRLWAELYPAEAVGREPRWFMLGGGLKRNLQTLGLENIVAVEQVFESLRADTEWLATAASPEQRAKLEPRAVSQEERERARDRQLEEHASLRRQRAQDARSGELEQLKRRRR